MNAKILELRPDRLSEALAAGRTPVVGGSQGVSPDRNVTFLGRGGSDTTAVALAHGLDAHVCELYTDVPGIFTADPRLVDTAKRMATISFDEMLERSEEHTSELQSLMRNSYAVFCLKKKTTHN